MQQTLKKALKITGKALLIFVSFIGLYLLAAFILSRITINNNAQPQTEVTIYIKTNGVHTDIVVPAKNEQMDWTQEVKFANTAMQDTSANYLALGWGDKGFYLQTPQWSDLKASVAFKAASGLSTTAMHATYYQQLHENESCKKIVISKAQYAELISYIANSFTKDANGHFIYIPTKANYGPTDAFYEANGHYSLFYTCNTWSNNALKHAGLKSCLWTIFDTGIFLKYK